MNYFRPKTLNEAVSLIKKWKDRATLVAGGTNVIPDLRAKKVNPQVLIDISLLKNLSYIKEEKGRIRIGSLTPISEIAGSKVIRKQAPILFDAANQIGNPLVRNRATIGGNLAHASPAADTAVPLLALGATVVLEGIGRKRKRVSIDTFFLGPNRTVLVPGEVIREISFPKPVASSRMAYVKMGLRNAMAISIVSMSALVEIDRCICRKVRIGLGAVAPRPIRAYAVEEMLTGKELTEELIARCAERAEEGVAPISDIRGGAEYRRAVTGVLLKRVLSETLHQGAK